MFSIDYLLSHSNLPGPRGNLELLHSFAREADDAVSLKCLSYIKDDTANSPDEFVGMCGVVGYAVSHKQSIADTMLFLRTYVSHPSWRIRESVAIAVQEIAEGNMDAVLKCFESWIDGTALEKRAAAAALCEPKLLINEKFNRRILAMLNAATETFKNRDKLTDDEKVLRKTLGYGWSVLIVSLPDEGKRAFEELLGVKNKHYAWIVKENLCKNRLMKMDREWTEAMRRKTADR